MIDIVDTSLPKNTFQVCSHLTHNVSMKERITLDMILNRETQNDDYPTSYISAETDAVVSINHRIRGVLSRDDHGDRFPVVYCLFPIVYRLLPRFRRMNA